MIDPYAHERGLVIREKRKFRKMTLSALAEKTGLSVSFLSQVEKGMVNPSINSLRRIALALDTNLSSLFEDSQLLKGPVVRKSERRLLLNKDSRLIYQLLSYDINRRIEFLLTTLGIGASNSASPMTHKGDEAALILQGTCRFEIGNDTYDLNEGDSIYIFENTPHKFTNTANVPLIIVSAISPPGF